MIEKKKRMTCIPNRMWAISFSGRAAQVGIRNSPQNKTNFNKTKNSEVDIFFVYWSWPSSSPDWTFLFCSLSIDSTTWSIFHMCILAVLATYYMTRRIYILPDGVWIFPQYLELDHPRRFEILEPEAGDFTLDWILFLSRAIQHPHENDISNQIIMSSGF